MQPTILRMLDSVKPQSPSLPSRQRIGYIDTAKGICIFLVVLGHCYIPQSGFLSMLRMPLYFTLSGFFFKDYGGLLPTFIKKCNKILIPFFFFYTAAFVILMAKVWAGAKVSHSFVAFFLSKDYLHVNGVLWFLLALFWSNMVFMILHRISSNMIFLGVASFSLMGLSLCLFTGDTFLPAYIDSGLTAMPFFFLGYYLRSTPILTPNKYDRYKYFTIPALLGIAVIVFLIGDAPNVTISCNEITGCVPLFFIASTALVVATLLLCKAIGTIPFITYIGRYSLIILGIHMPIIETVLYCLLLCGVDCSSFPMNVCAFVVSISIASLLIKPLIRWFPKFTAQEDLIVINRWK